MGSGFNTQGENTLYLLLVILEKCQTSQLNIVVEILKWKMKSSLAYV